MRLIGRRTATCTGLFCSGPSATRAPLRAIPRSAASPLDRAHPRPRAVAAARRPEEPLRPSGRTTSCSTPSSFAASTPSTRAGHGAGTARRRAARAASGLPSRERRAGGARRADARRRAALPDDQGGAQRRGGAADPDGERLAARRPGHAHDSAGLRSVLYAFLCDREDPARVIAAPGGYLLAAEAGEQVGDVTSGRLPARAPWRVRRARCCSTTRLSEAYARRHHERRSRPRRTTHTPAEAPHGSVAQRTALVERNLKLLRAPRARRIEACAEVD